MIWVTRGDWGDGDFFFRLEVFGAYTWGLGGCCLRAVLMYLALTTGFLGMVFLGFLSKF